MSELLAMGISDDVRRRILDEEADKSDRLSPHVEALRAADSLIVEGLRAKVRAIVDKPDLGPGDLLAIEQVARVGREMIAAGRNPGAIMRRKMLGGINASAQSIADEYLGGSPGEYSMPGYQGPLATAPGVETFGASALREVVSIAREFLDAKLNPKLKPKKVDLVAQLEAIAKARDLGLDDVAERLKREIEGATEGEAESDDAQVAEGRPCPKCGSTNGVIVDKGLEMSTIHTTPEGDLCEQSHVGPVEVPLNGVMSPPTVLG